MTCEQMGDTYEFILKGGREITLSIEEIKWLRDKLDFVIDFHEKEEVE